MLRNLLLLIFLFTTLGSQLLATGPSYINAEIRPISINKKGEILCRTRFFKNPSGGHYELAIEYGLCVLTNDTIRPFPIHTVSFEEADDSDDWAQNYEVYKKQLVYWDSIYLSDFKPRKKSDIDYHLIEKEYGFKKANVSRFERNDSISVAEIAKNKNIDLQKKSQKGLYGARGSLSEDTFVRILYDFGDIIIIRNRESDACDGEEYSTGSWFDYPNIWGGADIGYDCQTVTGVLFIN